MTDAEIYRHVDHTLLAPTATWAGIKTLCEEALAHGTASVCIPPSYVGRVKEAFPGGPVICTVIGFPLGYDVAETKLAATKTALAEGAGEIDMVVNLGDVKNGDFDKVEREIAAMKQAAGAHILKVIIETCFLTEAEKIELCKRVTSGGADFIKTSTGFGSGGATMDDVLLLGRHIGPNVRVKAAGGIRTRDDMVAFIEAGCDRLGTSSAVKILQGERAGGY